MSQILQIQLGKATLKRLNETTDDEIYVIGAVRVKDKDQNVLSNLSKIFDKVSPTVFREEDKNRPKQLSPTGDLYNELLPDGAVAEIVVMLMEEDTSSITGDIRREFDKFINEADGSIEEIVSKAKYEQYSELAALLLRFIDFLVSVFDKDDVIGISQHKERLGMRPPNNPISKTITFPANLDGEYDPVEYTITLSAAP